jgi:phosphatidylglycerol:prolipoprotein diacylglycerol transferase
MGAFWQYWQHLPEHINPYLIDIGGFKIGYYGVMYIVGFLTTYYLARWRLKNENRFDIGTEQLEGLMTAALLGLMIGGRVGYAVFYNFSFFVGHPLEAVLPISFHGGMHLTGIYGMSYHGGLIGVIFGLYAYCKKSDIPFLEVTDLLCPAIPLGYTFGRIGNFINGELYGRVTLSSIGMYFPLAPGFSRRHPTQLYEAFFEGIILFLVLFNLRKIIKTPGSIFGLYLVGYGLARFLIEYIREPDAQLGFILSNLTMGQVLCGGMIVGGIYLFLQSPIKLQDREVLNESR